MSGTEAGGASDVRRGKSRSPAAPDASAPCDAIVVGSGFGGAVTACRLAQAGLVVDLFERGRRYALSDFPAMPKAGELWPEARRWTWAGSNGLWDLRNLDGLSIAQAAGYGGGSLVYANVHLRPPADVFDDAWPENCRGRTGLDPYFDLVGYTLDVKPVPPAWREAGKTRVMADAFRTATNGAPENVFHPPLAIRFPAASPQLAPFPPPPTPEDELPTNLHGRAQGDCQRCGGCDFGCRYGAKNTLDRNYLAMAEDTHRVRVHTLTEVNRVAARDGGGYRVDYHDHLLDRPGSLEAPYVFLCGGSVNTTELLLRSMKQGLPSPAPAARDDPPEPGRRYFFNADALAMIFDANQETFPSAGPVITTALIHDSGSRRPRHTHTLGRSRFLIEDGGYPASMEHLFSLFRTPLLLGRNRFDPPRESPTALTAIRAPIEPSIPDRYPAFVGGLLAALREGTLPDRLPPMFKVAYGHLKDLAKILRDDEIGELTEAVRDAVFLKSSLFKKLRQWGLDKRAPWLWRWLYRLLIRAVAVDRKQLLATTLEVTHHRYGVDDPKTFPDRVMRAVMGERYPVNAPENDFERPLPEAPPPDGGRRALLLAMGRDDLPATLKLVDGRLTAEFVDAAFPTLAEEERVMRGIADALGGTLRASPLWSFARRPISAHSHGGCTLGVVTDQWGEVNANANLYINDGALLPGPVGVNPSATIAALAERNMEHFVREKLHHTVVPWHDELEAAAAWATASRSAGVTLEPPRPRHVHLTHQPIGFSFIENMSGYLMPAAERPSCLPDPKRKTIPQAPFLVAEQQGRATGVRASFALHARVQDIGSFLNDRTHPLPLEGTIELQTLPNGDVVRHVVRSGTMNLLTDAAADRRVMAYTLVFDWENRPWTLKGLKEIFDDPGFDAWMDTSILYTELHEGEDTTFHEAEATVRARGILRLGIKDFLDNQFQGLAAQGTTDPARVVWTLGSFGVFFFGQLQGIYAPEIDRFRHLFGSGWRAQPIDVKRATPQIARLMRGL